MKNNKLDLEFTKMINAQKYGKEIEKTENDEILSTSSVRTLNSMSSCCSSSCSLDDCHS